MTHTVTINTDPTTGEQTMSETSQLTTGGVKSSADTEPTGGVKVANKDGRFVQEQGDLQNDDVIEYGGMQVSVGVLHEMGLLPHAFDEAKSSAMEAHGQAGGATGDTEGSSSGKQEGPQYDPSNPYDVAEQAIHEDQNNEVMSYEEAHAAVTALGNLEMQGIAPDAAAEAALAVSQGAQDYEVADMLGGSDSYSLVKHNVDQMRPMMEQSARAELGDEGFAKLQEMAKMSPAVNAAVLSYGIQRALGKTGGNRWTDLKADIANFMNTGE